jgi:scyllo-inositol 2-dehydrogenase (NADP+)
MAEIRAGLVGYGVGGAVFHAPLIRAVRALELAAVVTSRAERAEQVRKDIPGARALSSVDELLADRTIGLVVVASPSGTHYEVAHKCLEAGKHVVVDKPFATKAAEADALMELAERNRLLLTVFQNRRWDGDFLTVRQCVQEGWLGTVCHYESHFDRFRPQVRSVWREKAGPGSGILYDLGSHLIDQALQLFGMPGSVWADVFPQRPGAETEDYFHLVLNYGRMRAILHGAMVVRQPGPRFILHGDAGSFTKQGMDPQEDALRAGKVPGDPGWGEDIPGNYGDIVPAEGPPRKAETQPGAYQRFYAATAEALLHGKPPPVDPADSRDGLVVLEAALRSAMERRAINLA